MSDNLFDLTEEQREIQRTARDFAAAEIAPHVARWDEEAFFEPSLPRKFGELGFLGMLIPEEYDGLGLDAVSYLVALEEIAAADATFAPADLADALAELLRGPQQGPPRFVA